MNRVMPARLNDETQFNRGAWVVLLIALLIFGIGIFSIVYRYLLPTDGWSYLYDNQVLVFNHNLVGVRSELHSGDGLNAVNGISSEQIMNDSDHQSPPNWRVGGWMTYTILRDEQLIPIEIPVVAWTPVALLQYLSDDPVTLSGDVGILAMLAVTVFAFLRRPGNTSARLLLLIGAILTAQLLNQLLPIGASDQFDALAHSLYTIWNQVMPTAFAPTVLAFTLIFPHPKMIVLRHPKLVWLPFVWGAVLQTGLILGFSGDVAWASMMLIVILSIASMVHSAFTMRDTVSRAQIRWALGGFGLGILCLLVVWLIETINLWADPLFKAIHSILGGLAFLITHLSLKSIG